MEGFFYQNSPFLLYTVVGCQILPPAFNLGLNILALLSLNATKKRGLWCWLVTLPDKKRSISWAFQCKHYLTTFKLSKSNHKRRMSSDKYLFIRSIWTFNLNSVSVDMDLWYGSSLVCLNISEVLIIINSCLLSACIWLNTVCRDPLKLLISKPTRTSPWF